MSITPKLFTTTRLAFSEKFQEKIYSFSEKYCREHFKIFREKWNQWQQENAKELDEEIQKIQQSGIKDTPEEIKEKIYTSARFYARKRSKQQEKKQKQQQPKHTKLPPVSDSIKKTIEEFVKTKLKTIKNNPEKPIELYAEYCETYIIDINTEINRLRQITNGNPLNPQEISLKFKKAFHNYIYRKYSIAH